MSQYAGFVLRRRAYVPDLSGFANAYLEGFRRRLQEVQTAYRARRSAFDELFSDRPYDTNGSGAYRWAKSLQRLDACDPEHIVAILKSAVETAICGDRG